jgi:hypothetical protein
MGSWRDRAADAEQLAGPSFRASISSRFLPDKSEFLPDVVGNFPKFALVSACYCVAWHRELVSTGP